MEAQAPRFQVRERPLGKHYPFEIVDTTTSKIISLEFDEESAERAAEYMNGVTIDE